MKHVRVVTDLPQLHDGVHQCLCASFTLLNTTRPNVQLVITVLYFQSFSIYLFKGLPSTVIKSLSFDDLIKEICESQRSNPQLLLKVLCECQISNSGFDDNETKYSLVYKSHYSICS